MDGAFATGGPPEGVRGEGTGAAEEAPTAGRELRNGHALSASEEREVETPGDQEWPVTWQAEAEELLARARAHAELLRAHAEAARAEAASLRAEAAALRRAAGEGLTDTISRAEALAVEMHGAADALRSVIEEEADGARAEVERVRAEAESLRSTLHAEADAAQADTRRLRAEVQQLRAEISELAGELRTLSRDRRATDSQSPELGLNREANAPLDELRRIVAMEVEQSLTNRHGEPRERPARGEPRAPFAGFDRPEPVFWPERRHDPDAAFPLADVRERFRRIWDATYAEATGQAPVSEQPDAGGPSGPRAPEPLIGSGGWRPGPGRASPAGGADGGAAWESSAPEPGRHRRRFGRPA